VIYVSEISHAGDETSDRVADRAEFSRTLAQSDYDNVTVLALSEAADVLTDRRRELIAALRAGEYESIRDLAREVGRDKGAVSRDLAVLAEHGVTTLEENGRAKRPVLRTGTIVVEPVAVTHG
jgi:predicted transcriptional regulator